MRVEITKRGVNSSPDLLKQMKELEQRVGERRAVRSPQGLLLSHNAYIKADIHSRIDNSVVELRSETSDRVLAVAHFAENGRVQGFKVAPDDGYVTIE